MLHNILIGLDGSPYGEVALECGIRWATRTGCVLIGLGVIDEPSILKPEPVGIGGSHYKQHSDQVRLNDAKCRVEAFLIRFVQQCAKAEVLYRALKETGDPAQRLLFHGEDIDLILLGQQTYFHFETQAMADGTLETVLRRSHRPVVAVPRELPRDGRVMVAYDGSRPAARALESFQSSGLGKGQEVHVVSVAADEKTAARRAEEGTKFLCFHGIEAQARPLPSAEAPAELLLRQASELDASMIVLGAYGRSRVSEFLFGSITRSILSRSNRILFMHP
jgi:nucleotide-binding universal stress UspA family protein